MHEEMVEMLETQRQYTNNIEAQDGKKFNNANFKYWKI